ncbi:uncharacterized protein LOC111342193 [Stylophora pistillata]|uniref:uncharacterized protein LOC111342193 n=1 Tax=Stylophora pistillata TaxID=50429 RepID=UPI000C03972C|nr:uncharacterized protein LOC111342193 [Stylophora pistillata]
MIVASITHRKNEWRSGWKSQTSHNKYQNNQKQMYTYPLKEGGGGESTEVINQVSVTEVNQEAQAISFKTGRIHSYINEWVTLTSDSSILDIVKGCKIEFNRGPPYQLRIPKPIRVTCKEAEFIEIEISRLLEKGVIVLCQYEGEFLSNFFVTPKKDGSYRLILNLKNFNKNVAYHPFKMVSLQSVIQMMKRDCFMASIDLREAYYLVKIDANYQKFLKFSWNNQLYKFTCLPNGLACAPRLFTKLLKPVYSTLRSRGFLSVAYIDDSYLQGNDFGDCLSNVNENVELFIKLEFVIHPVKSVELPTQELFSRFHPKFQTNVCFFDKRKSSLKDIIKKTLELNSASIRDLAKVVGKLVAAFPGCLYGSLHYRCLESDKTAALKEAKGDFDAPIIV